jgi:hypothetical protein
MHIRMRWLDLLTCVLGRAARGQRRKLDQVFLQQRDVLGSRPPGLRLASMERETSAGDSLPVPVNPRVIQHPSGEIHHDVGDAGHAPKPVKKCQLLRGYRAFVGVPARGRRTGPRLLRLLDTLFAGALARTGQLLRLGHALAGPLVCLAAARGEEVGVGFLCWAGAAAS